MKPKQAVLRQLELETRYGNIQSTSHDNETYLLDGNLNQKTEDENQLLNNIKEYTTPADIQFRNHSEHSTGLIKKYLIQTCGMEKIDTIPVMKRNEIGILLDKGDSMGNRITSPVDTLPFRNYNNMTLKLKDTQERRKIRKTHLIQESSRKQMNRAKKLYQQP